VTAILHNLVEHYSYVVHLIPAYIIRVFQARGLFKLTICQDMSDIILRNTNGKYRKV